MRKVLLFLCLSLLFSSVVSAEVSQYEKPTEFEFTVYKYIMQRLWDLPPGKAAEDALMRKAAEKFGITFEDANNIYVKFTWYEFQIADTKSNYRDGDIIVMTLAKQDIFCVDRAFC